MGNPLETIHLSGEEQDEVDIISLIVVPLVHKRLKKSALTSDWLPAEVAGLCTHLSEKQHAALRRRLINETGAFVNLRSER